MKRLLAAGLVILFGSSIGFAGETIVSGPDAVPYFKSALGRAINVRFSESFAKNRLPSRDLDGVCACDLLPGKLCLAQDGEGDQALDAMSPVLAPFFRKENGDFCIPLEDVSLRLPPPQASPNPKALPAPFYHLHGGSSCSWVWRQGKGVGLWTEQCTRPDADGHITFSVAYDEKEGAFKITSDGKQSFEPLTVLQMFRVEGGMRRLLPHLKARRLVPDDPGCVLSKPFPIPLLPDAWSGWQVIPTGEKRAAMEVQQRKSVGPCGPLGLDTYTFGFFMVHKDQPDDILFVRVGEDIAFIDLPSITLGP